MEKPEAEGVFESLITERICLRSRLLEVGEEIGEAISHLPLSSIVGLFGSVHAYPVWTKGRLSVDLLVNKDKLGGCGILLWGCQFENNYDCLAIKVHEFKVKFMVFDGQPGSHDFAMLNGSGPGEAKKLFENLRRICYEKGVNYVFVKNARLLMDSVKFENNYDLCPTKEFREISEFYMQIARPDGDLIPEFGFIDPQASSAFWSNYG